MTIRLNKQTQEKEKIQQLIKQSILNPTYELECIVGGDFKKGYTVSFQQFNKIISRINGKREFDTKRPEDKLTISFPRDSRYHNIRITVNGFNAINYYCINDKLESIMANVNFETKERVKDNLDQVIVPVYNLKFNQKSETEMDKDQSIIKDLLRDWRDLPKVFRYKKAYHFVSIDGMFSLDCSIVRTSSVANRELTVEEVIESDLLSKVQKPADEKMPFIDWWKRISKNPKEHVMVKNTGLYFKSVKESHVFENPLTYEVEVEFIGNKILVPDDNTSHMLRQKYLSEPNKDNVITGIFSNMFKYIGIVLQCVQDSFYILSNDDILKIIGDYTRLTGKHKTDAPLFFGPLPVDLDKNKLIPLPDNAYENMSRVYDAGNILIDYCVTDKSDGVRNLLFIDSNGDCYLIGRDSISAIKNVGIRIPSWANSLFDGEYLEYDTNTEYLNKFVIFDAYFIKGKNIMSAEFGDGKTNMEQSRYGAILAFTGQISTGQGIQMISDKLPFRIDKKTFLFGELSTTPVKNRNYNLIFQQSARLLNKMNKQYGGTLTEGNLYSYKTDGLIYTPVRLGVYQSNPTTNIPDSRLVTSRKWDKCYKWKPSQFLTIDFRVVLLKDIKNNERQYIYYGSQKYARAELRCMNYASRINSYGDENIRDTNIKYDSGLNAYLLNEGMNLETLPLEMPFMATYPFLGVRDIENNLVMTTSQCLIPVSETGELLTEEGEQLYDGDTVEFRYISPDAPEPHEQDKHIVVEDDAMRWRALRVRRGKQPNALRVCLDIWALMHSPVTSKHVANGLTDEDLSSGDLNYYLGTENNVFITDPLKKFNNFVKGVILSKYLKTQTKPKLLDLGCGKLGDVWKYTINNVQMLVGIDLSHDNLNNKVDGAATRIFQNINKDQRIKAISDRTLLINGSFTASLVSGDAGSDMLAKYYLDILYGRFKPITNPRLMRFYNLGVDGYNCVTSMYVIHYAFNTESDLDQYLENVSSSLKEQGYFIGTCFDGNSILDKLNGSHTPGMVEGLVDGTTVWRIDNKTFGTGIKHTGEIYDANMALQVKPGLAEIYTTESPYVIGTGNKINVYYETINNISQENLVDIKFLEYKAEQHGLKLLESRCFTEEPGSMLTEYLSTGKTDTVERVEEIKKEKALMQWAEWNRYFVFQKM